MICIDERSIYQKYMIIISRYSPNNRVPKIYDVKIKRNEDIESSTIVENVNISLSIMNKTTT
jgi:hypothetical protein